MWTAIGSDGAGDRRVLVSSCMLAWKVGVLGRVLCLGLSLMGCDLELSSTRRRCGMANASGEGLGNVKSARLLSDIHRLLDSGLRGELSSSCCRCRVAKASGEAFGNVKAPGALCHYEAYWMDWATYACSVLALSLHAATGLGLLRRGGPLRPTPHGGSFL